jgi:hypothetical protein
VGDIDGTSDWDTGLGWWTAEVTVAVHSLYHDPVAAAVVTATGTVSTTNMGIVVANLSCTTQTDGRCAFAALPGYKIHPDSPSVVLQIVAVEYGTVPYGSEHNHDEEGDSDGTTIVLQRPP